MHWQREQPEWLRHSHISLYTVEYGVTFLNPMGNKKKGPVDRKIKLAFSTGV
jgi:hypothetical protein